MAARMKRAAITITEQDSRRLADVIALFEEVDGAATSALRAKLDRALVVPPTAIAPSIVTMNSRVVCRDARGTTRDVEIVYPWHEDAAAGRISVLGAFGRALLGAAIGARVEVVANGRRTTFWIDAVPYQPEAAGEFHL